MKHYTTIKTALAAAIITTVFASLAGSASAQAYVQRSSTYYTRPAYTARPAYSNPYTSGYGNYGYYNYYNNYGYNNRLYRSSNWNKKVDFRKDSRERFRDLRHDSKYPNRNYNNDKYDRNHPYDSRYYNRNYR